MNLVTPDKILATPVSGLADQSSDSLFRLKNDAADFLAAAKAIGKLTQSRGFCRTRVCSTARVCGGMV